MVHHNSSIFQVFCWRWTAGSVKCFVEGEMCILIEFSYPRQTGYVVQRATTMECLHQELMK